MSIFPIDIDITQRSKYPTRRRLRPEFLKSFTKKLNPDTFDLVNINKKSDKLESDLTDANKTLKSVNVLELVNKLDRMEYLPLDSYGFTKIFHEFGVNLRYLGLVAQHSKLPHIQEVCTTEMVARSCKRILNYKLSRFTVLSGEKVKHLKDGLSHLNSDEIQEFKDRFEKNQKKIVVDLLNVIFGKSDLSEDF